MASMRNYELTFIVHPEVDEPGMATIVDKVKDFITSKGGQISQLDHWGRRRLAYPIRKLVEGQYVFVLAQLPAGILRELERLLQLNENVLRYLLIRQDE